MTPLPLVLWVASPPARYVVLITSASPPHVLHGLQPACGPQRSLNRTRASGYSPPLSQIRRLSCLLFSLSFSRLSVLARRPQRNEPWDDRSKLIPVSRSRGP
ncbi:hypothetical protein BD309DRAFT_953229 [Dichomitus squalens]|uniref:Uncharacterized protein n=1 Tax=Dichomitus squalens TaxID=114155 RepID=A0A4Q9P476_9APHY|nr:hypothetical protein BD309DRAFT_953229 [Dichomitus squalens]TBU63033.1 hypothetical protein BD310DRAFT_917671 [Dichomitus squalens]